MSNEKTKKSPSSPSTYAFYKKSSMTDGLVKMMGGDLTKKEESIATTDFCFNSCPLTCPSPFKLDESSNTCVPTPSLCGTDLVFDSTSKTCVPTAKLCGKGTAFANGKCILSESEKKTTS